MAGPEPVIHLLADEDLGLIRAGGPRAVTAYATLRDQFQALLALASTTIPAEQLLAAMLGRAATPPRPDAEVR